MEMSDLLPIVEEAPYLQGTNLLVELRDYLRVGQEQLTRFTGNLDACMMAKAMLTLRKKGLIEELQLDAQNYGKISQIFFATTAKLEGE